MNINSLVVIAIQITAFAPYILGSRRFYYCHKWQKYNYLRPLLLGIVLDLAVMIIGHLQFERPPWHSWLFRSHLVLAGSGLLGFIALFFYLLAKGKYHGFERLRPFQYRILLPAWCIGSGIGLTNFMSKTLTGARLYDRF